MGKGFPMKIYQSVLLLGSLLLSSQLIAARDAANVIYGEDNRVDVFESRNSAFVELSKSTAAMIGTENLRSLNGEVIISSQTLQERGICATERFAKQISAANCSGFLVSDNILITAGHCIRSESDCKSYKWVFDFKVDHADQRDVTVSSSSVYSCKRVIAQSLDQRTKDDYAMIELDRKVTDRRPLSFRKQGKVPAGTDIVVIGHPTGIPTKIADGAKVRSLQDKFFVANLDTYGGNSGSAVFNVRTSEVEGILVRGENDYVYDARMGCQVSNKCTDSGCRGEDVTYITNIKELKDI
jgi:V8-like Glu-specific endopeptidase